MKHQNPNAAAISGPTLFGHPAGLFTLFFTEMWERFSYYGMRALLVFYMIKGFLGFNDQKAYAVYGAYTALVYATPFIGGMLADRLIGARRAVIFGAILMAGGHLAMTVETKPAFFAALALLIVGNGFFKPNISTMVGDLYPEKSSKRDSGFTLFYMGINLGAVFSPLLCGYLGETYGWHYGFGVATLGMILGLLIFIVPLRLAQILILSGTVGTAISLMWLQDSVFQLAFNAFVSLALVVGGVIGVMALQRGGLPEGAGEPNENARKIMKAPFFFLSREKWVYVGTLIMVPVFAFLVQRSELAGYLLSIFGGAAFLYLLISAFRATSIERGRLFVILILMFFSMLFWAFFEQAGSSINNFTDRNVDRVVEREKVDATQVGQILSLEMNQEQLGHRRGSEVVTLSTLDRAREAKALRVDWEVQDSNVGMGVEGSEIPASLFQSANPFFILIFGLIFAALWAFLASRGLEPSTSVKFALGLLQLGLGFGVLWYGAQHADSRGMVAMGWLLLGYLLHTTGELCLSPVGLAMVTRLSPARMVSTVMGAWFLATAFSNFLAGMIAGLTGVSVEGDESGASIPPPIETVGVYGEVFGHIALFAMGAALVLFVLAPFLNRWIRAEDDPEHAPEEAPHSHTQKRRTAVDFSSSL